MATKKLIPYSKFEQSGKDIDKKGVKEGSKKDMAMDKKQAKAGGFAPFKKGMK